MSAMLKGWGQTGPKGQHLRDTMPAKCSVAHTVLSNFSHFVLGQL